MKPVSGIAILASLLLAGCASFDGKGLASGSSVAQVEAVMGPPKDKVAVAGGDTIWFYPRGPFSPYTFAVRMSAAGTMLSVEQVLTMENFSKIRIGQSTGRDVRELIGPPMGSKRLERQQREVWGYTVESQIGVRHYLYVQFSADGIVREVIMVRDPNLDKP